MMFVLFVVCYMPHVEMLTITCVSLKLLAYPSGQSVQWDQRVIAYPLFLNPEIAAMHWSDLKSSNELVVLTAFPGFWF